MSCNAATDDDMPPLASPSEGSPPLTSPPLAPHVMLLSVRIKAEAGETAKSDVKPLTAYSSTPSLIEDRSGLLEEDGAAKQHEAMPPLRSEYPRECA
jgi:hypothetical protein